MAQIIDGKARAKEIRKQLKGRVHDFQVEAGHPPGLGVILVGEDPASAVYVRNKERACARTGIRSFHHPLAKDATQQQLEQLIDQLNEDPEVHGILLQLPLPSHLDAEPLLLRISPDKDADGFHPVNAGRLAVGQPTFVPCTPLGCIDLLHTAGVTLQGADAVVVGRSNIVGKPVAQLLLAEGATVTICHSKTQNLAAHIGRADVVVAAVGRPEMIRGEWIKPGAAVIDVGINRIEDGSIVGDVEFEAASERAGCITPVPGGVGPMTVAKLLENTLAGAIRFEECKLQE
ncbi:MAG: bifunctional methylenetetrahydrofolate dehydrogenase/methenyltetrahydrofolate cyclohydrolase FolD [Planctomycetes bacterium]|jgi:methylenetetrahydrofolate dehydrogenase (NADP+)/methenyltetrahydrofolate cyclohydrolase|nr:bifunctional methylenetetrahydrofolate dehydrogenase/methenyltetrahydrofolate cyclohydrolase FolD [Planctomycetota bacterium]MBT6453000.1 bifunctional methylenetetrahydrofolate dehydrogenase/methenyltetrahydrofolate cyclohydrolase FolD [Planctomycetota bacterium]MBT6541839.1 bifunctional methylenetetrahydrofolate dehydrogenase/methenyltetrahydrofolate cyclohydrolase FolD [Planctomycetota bacterium]MBT6783504.1 bifunctional methylenetetrahydrofolate dehydrogenase/methenyltetrahydrofolate cyclo